MQDQRSFSVPDPFRSSEGGQAVAEPGGEATGDLQITLLAPAVLYAAKSTEDKHGSIPDQLVKTRRLSDNESWTTLGEFTDEGFSAYSGKTWWKIKYTYNTAPNDRTTWSASISGNPGSARSRPSRTSASVMAQATTTTTPPSRGDRKSVV